MAANLLATEAMNWKPLVLSALVFVSLPAARAADPISYREIAMLLRTALKGGMPIDPFIARRILGATASLRSAQDEADVSSSQETLSKREVQILELVAQGLSNLEIAEHTNLSRWTVATHVKSIYAKFAVHTRTAAVRAGRGSGILR